MEDYQASLYRGQQLREADRRILHACLSTNPTTDFPLEVFCEEFLASAATFWIPDDFDENEMILSRWYNRPDLDNDHERKTFNINNSFAQKWKREKDCCILKYGVDQFKILSWDNRHLKEYAVKEFSAAAFICFRSDSKIYGLLHLYYHTAGPYFGEREISDLCPIIGAYIKTFSNEMRSIMVERRKIGHEIARMISQADSKVEAISKKLSRMPAMNKPIADLRKALSAAHEAASNKTFIEGVYDRMRSSKYLILRQQALTAFHLALSKFDRPFAMIAQLRIHPRAEIKFSEDDMGLLLSNIAMNAVKYTASGGSISIIFSYSNRGSVLTISNMSAKLSARELERVWRFGVRGGNADGVEGDGIGLSIISDICHAYRIRARLRQRRSRQTIWTDLTLSFPPRMCRLPRGQHEGA